MIRAECHSEDMLFAIKFDASPYMQAASLENIKKMAEGRWGLMNNACQQAVHHLKGFPVFVAMREMVHYCGIGDRSLMRWEVHLHPGDAATWLMENRAEDYRTLLEAGTPGLLPESPDPYWVTDDAWDDTYLTLDEPSSTPGMRM